MLDQVFEESKRVIVCKIKDEVKTFQINKPTCLSMDYNKTGVDYLLFQKHCNFLHKTNPNCRKGHWKIILAGSPFINNAESCYSLVEGPCLRPWTGIMSNFHIGMPKFISDCRPSTTH